MCGKCKESKGLEDFYRRGPNGRQSICKKCSSEQDSLRYRNETEAQKSRRREANKATKDKIVAEVNRLKGEPCTDCMVRYPPYVMQFDHLPGAIKNFNIAQARNKAASLKALYAEVDKCELVCANCHAERTHKRKL